MFTFVLLGCRSVRPSSRHDTSDSRRRTTSGNKPTKPFLHLLLWTTVTAAAATTHAPTLSNNRIHENNDSDNPGLFGGSGTRRCEAEGTPRSEGETGGGKDGMMEGHTSTCVQQDIYVSSLHVGLCNWPWYLKVDNYDNQLLNVDYSILTLQPLFWTVLMLVWFVHHLLPYLYFLCI